MLRNLDIRKKLTVVMVTTSLGVILLSSICFLANQIYFSVGAREDSAASISEMIGYNISSALLFLDVQSARLTLESLKAESSVITAAIYDQSGKKFASYKRSEEVSVKSPEKVPVTGSEWHSTHFSLTTPVIDQHEFLGTLFLAFDRSALVLAIQNGILIIGGIFLFSIMFALLVASWGQRVFSYPILSLVKVADSVATDQNYSLRASKTSEDEVGRLIDRFNNMLSVIEVSNSKLARHREQLEKEVKRRTAQLQDSEARTKAILKTAPDGILYTDEKGMILSVNPAAARMFGSSQEELLESSFFDLIRSKDSGGFEKILSGGAGVWEKKDITSFELEMKEKNGESFPAAISVSKVYQEGSVHFTLIVRDITEFKQAQEILQRAKDEAEAASRSKSEFLANMSHEIRTPMNGIIGMTGLALEASKSPAQRDYLNTVLESADSLLTILNDILDFSKIEAGKLSVEEVKFDLRELIENTIKAVLGKFSGRRNVELLCRIHPDVFDTFKGDPGRIRQVLINLIGNAEKFTRKGEVLLEVNQVSSEKEEARLRFEVKDTGIGIDQEKKQLIFDAFAQADSSTTRLYGGTGLGLSISSKLVSLMGGVISVESEEGKGSTFCFELPLRIHQELKAKPVPFDVDEFRDLSVLVVDDNAPSRDILEELFSGQLRMKTTVVESGRKALSLLKKFAIRRKPFDLIVSDYLMPGLNGAEFVKAVRKKQGSLRTPILMLSSADQINEIKGTVSDIDGYLIKPVFLASLVSALKKLFGGEHVVSENIPSGMLDGIKHHLDDGEGPHYNILVVEDNRINQRLIKKLLEHRGHKVVIAENGKVAISVLEESGYFNGNEAEMNKQIHLILMDIQMPVMGGIEATTEIRKREKETEKHMPIVALTAHALKGHREEYLNAGMDEYLTKPIETANLFRVLRTLPISEKIRRVIEKENLLEAKRANKKASLLERVDGDVDLIMEVIYELYDALEEQRRRTMTSSRMNVDIPRSPEETIDIKQLVARVGGEVSLLSEMIKEFCSMYNEKITQLRQAVLEKDAATIARSAAFMKSKLGDLCAHHACRAAGNLEDAALDDRISEISRYMNDLEKEVNHILPAFRTVIRNKKEDLSDRV